MIPGRSLGGIGGTTLRTHEWVMRISYTFDIKHLQILRFYVQMVHFEAHLMVKSYFDEE